LKDLVEDFKNGELLLQLLEILSGKTIPHFNSNPRNKFEIMENLNKVISFCIYDLTLNLDNVSASDIYEGKENCILGLTWSLISKYKIKTPNEDLLKWIQQRIPHYNISNFTNDWKTGKPLCELVNALIPGRFVVPQDFKHDPVADCTMAVECARLELFVPVLVDVEDMVNGPDPNTMMTYLSYFRDFVPESAIVKSIDRGGLTCSAIGPGLVTGNFVGKMTYFTIEVRCQGQSVNHGGHQIDVFVIGPSNQIKPKIFDNGDGTYQVEYVPKDPGNHVVEVKFNGEHLKPPVGLARGGSPFVVNIVGKVPVKETRPVPHWFVCIDSKNQRYLPYTNHISYLIEDKFDGDIQVDKYVKINKSRKLEINTKNNTSRSIVRGTWFWQADDGSWSPYEEKHATKLEEAYQKGAFENNVKISTPDGKVRWVAQIHDGSFKQFRYSKKARGEGRYVHRGFLGKIEYLNVSNTKL